MIRNNANYIPLLLCLSLYGFATMGSAQELNVTISANIRETTCDMILSGGTNNTVAIGTEGKVGLDKILAGDISAAAIFSLKITECPASLSSLKTTVKGEKSADLNTAISNSSGDGNAENMGLSIARKSAPDSLFVINSTVDSERLVWTDAEITAKEVQLVARLTPTKTDLGTTGYFNAVATFEFTYE